MPRPKTRWTVPLLVAALLIPLSTTPSFAVGTETETSDSFDIRQEMRLARGNLKSESYRSALTRLKKVVKAEPRNADAQNLLGYSYRKLGKLKRARFHYDKALEINPDHFGALEYQGQLFLELGEQDKAKANFARAKKICGGPCPANDFGKPFFDY